MRNKVLMITQAPGLGPRSKDPLDGAAGRRLAALAGIDLPELLARLDRVNLLPEWPDGLSDDQARSLLFAARDSADRLRTRMRGRRALLVGRAVAAAFRLLPDDYDWFQPIEAPPGLEIAVVPYAAGISRWWSDPENMRRARDLMLAVKLGFFGFRRVTPRRVDGFGRREMFSPAQIAAALEAGRGVYTWSAEALAEATGIRVTDDTIANYVARYPDLRTIEQEQTARILNLAKRNIIRDIEAGGVESSWKLLRSRVGQGSGFELVVNAKVDARIQHHHSGAVGIRITRDDVQAMSPRDRAEAYREMVRGERILDFKKPA